MSRTRKNLHPLNYERPRRPREPVNELPLAWLLASSGSVAMAMMILGWGYSAELPWFPRVLRTPWTLLVPLGAMAMSSFMAFRAFEIKLRILWMVASTVAACLFTLVLLGLFASILLDL